MAKNVNITKLDLKVCANCSIQIPLADLRDHTKTSVRDNIDELKIPHITPHEKDESNLEDDLLELKNVQHPLTKLHVKYNVCGVFVVQLKCKCLEKHG